MHKQVKLLPGLTITAQFIFTILFGPLGLLLAIPMAVVIQVFVKEIIIHDILEKIIFQIKNVKKKWKQLLCFPRISPRRNIFFRNFRYIYSFQIHPFTPH